MHDKPIYMNEYETIYILKHNLNDESAKNFILKIKDLIKNLGGKNIKIDCLGRRKLAWKRKKEYRGIYVHHSYLATGKLIYNIEKSLTIDESTLLRQTKLIKRNIDINTINEKVDNLEIKIINERKEPVKQNYNFNPNSLYEDKSKNNGAY